MIKPHCPQVVVALNCRVDEEIAMPLVLLNHLPFIRTFGSCQGMSSKDWAVIYMTPMSAESELDFLRFFIRLAREFHDQFPSRLFEFHISLSNGEFVATLRYNRDITDLVNKYIAETVNREIDEERAVQAARAKTRSVA